MKACTDACLSIYGALGPFGELFFVLVAGIVAWVSRRQVVAARKQEAVSAATADAYKTSLLSIRPAGLLQDALRPAPVPKIEIRPSTPEE